MTDRNLMDRVLELKQKYPLSTSEAFAFIKNREDIEKRPDYLTDKINSQIPSDCTYRPTKERVLFLASTMNNTRHALTHFDSNGYEDIVESLAEKLSKDSLLTDVNGIYMAHTFFFRSRTTSIPDNLCRSDTDIRVNNSDKFVDTLSFIFKYVNKLNVKTDSDAVSAIEKLFLTRLENLIENDLDKYSAGKISQRIQDTCSELRLQKDAMGHFLSTKEELSYECKFDHRPIFTRLQREGVVHRNKYAVAELYMLNATGDVDEEISNLKKYVPGTSDNILSVKGSFEEPGVPLGDDEEASEVVDMMNSIVAEQRLLLQILLSQRKKLLANFKNEI